MKNIHICIGTLAVLNAAFDANVSKVVLTSSAGAIFTLGVKNVILDESQWCSPVKTDFNIKSLSCYQGFLNITTDANTSEMLRL